MRVRNIIGAGLIAGAGLLSTNCDGYSGVYKKEAIETYNSRKVLLENVIQDKTQSEMNAMFSNSMWLDTPQMQHSIDSTAFSDVFQGSEKAKDSTFIAEYNEMMGKTKILTMYNATQGKHIVDYRKMNQKLADVLNLKEMREIERNPVLPENGGKGYFESGKQFLVDSVYHHKLFEKHGLLEGKGMKTFTEICKKVRP